MIKNINEMEQNFLNTAKQKESKPTKEDLQIKKLQLQIETLEQKKKEKEQKQIIAQYQQKQSGTMQALKIVMYILLAPFLIIGFFLIECAKEAGRGGRGRR